MSGAPLPGIDSPLLGVRASGLGARDAHPSPEPLTPSPYLLILTRSTLSHCDMSDRITESRTLRPRITSIVLAELQRQVGDHARVARPYLQRPQHILLELRHGAQPVHLRPLHGELGVDRFGH